jgi:hypothetical protein
MGRFVPLGFIPLNICALYAAVHCHLNAPPLPLPLPAYCLKEKPEHPDEELYYGHYKLSDLELAYDKYSGAEIVGVQYSLTPDDEKFEPLEDEVYPPWYDLMNKEGVFSFLQCEDGPRTLREALAAGEVEATLQETDGELTPMPTAFWRTSNADDVMDHDHLVAVPLPGRVACGHIVMREGDLVKACGKELEGAWPIYLPPYVAFMFRVVQALGLTQERRLTKDQVMHRLREMWPADLGEPSKGKIEFMATFLRHPEDEAGGYYKPERAANATGAGPTDKKGRTA